MTAELEELLRPVAIASNFAYYMAWRQPSYDPEGGPIYIVQYDLLAAYWRSVVIAHSN